MKLGTGYERKTANESPNAYHTYKANIGSTLPIGPLSVNTNLSLSQKKYDATDLVFSEERRRGEFRNPLNECHAAHSRISVTA